MGEERILIVDDEAHIRMLCTDILQRENYNVTSLGNSKEALQAARADVYDLLLTDISMPGMDGLELLAAVKETQREITAVLMTGYGTLDHAIQSIHLGAHGFLIKPFSQKELIQAVEDALERSRLSRENMRLRLLLPLFEVSKTLLSELNLGVLLDKLTEVALKETGSDTATVNLIEDSGRFVMHSYSGPSRLDSQSKYQEIIHTMGQWVLEHKQPLVVFKETLILDSVRNMIAEIGFSGMVTIPFISKDKIVGLLNLGKKEGEVSYNQSDIELMSILCGQAAIAIENAKLFEAVRNKNQELEEFCVDSVKALAQAIEAKDHITGSHGDRLVNYAMAIADRFSLPKQEKIWLGYAAALHDIGKIAVSESILKKPSKLTSDEYDEMKTHPARGAEILREIKFLAPVVPIVYYHQEQYNGKGYPEGLRGSQIPIGSRIVAVLDAFDAMTSDRPYRKGLPMNTALNELKRYSGVQFDPKVVESFIEVVQGST
jgi:response regulator RpfG family c-di-GMP phosphodiesterase